MSPAHQTATVATAPGKILLAGEYAVLHGGPAVVIAIDRRVIASVTHSPKQQSPFLEQLCDVLIQRYGPGNNATATARHTIVDSRALYGDNGIKYGLGSSAAVTVAATALSLEAIGEAQREQIHETAKIVHAQTQHKRGIRGSGADIASCVYGGGICITPSQHPRTLPIVKPLSFTSQVVWVAVWTGIPADTVTLVQKVEQLRIRAPKIHEQICQDIAQAATDLAQALASVHPTHPNKIITTLLAGAQAIEALGRESQACLFRPIHRDIQVLAQRHGGGSKPTGAGAGDIAIVALPTTQAAQSFREDIQRKGLQIVNLQITPQGAHIESK